MFLSPRTSRMLFESGSNLTSDDFRLYERSQLEQVGSAFAEIQDAVPLYLGSGVTGDEENKLKAGHVYYLTLGDPIRTRDQEQRMGSEAIFFFSELVPRWGLIQAEMPFPLFATAPSQNWLDSRPRPIEDLPAVSRYAEQSNFREYRS